MTRLRQFNNALIDAASADPVTLSAAGMFPRMGPTRQLNERVWAIHRKPADQMTADDWRYLEQIEREGADQ